ncbi:MAG: hypothetical protein ACT4OI_11180 [Methanobacteriota archaeon]
MYWVFSGGIVVASAAFTFFSRGATDVRIAIGTLVVAVPVLIGILLWRDLRWSVAAVATSLFFFGWSVLLAVTEGGANGWGALVVWALFSMCSLAILVLATRLPDAGAKA